MDHRHHLHQNLTTLPELLLPDSAATFCLYCRQPILSFPLTWCIATAAVRDRQTDSSELDAVNFSFARFGGLFTFSSASNMPFVPTGNAAYQGVHKSAPSLGNQIKKGRQSNRSSDYCQKSIRKFLYVFSYVLCVGKSDIFAPQEPMIL